MIKTSCKPIDVTRAPFPDQLRALIALEQIICEDPGASHSQLGSNIKTNLTLDSAAPLTLKQEQRLITNLNKYSSVVHEQYNNRDVSSLIQVQHDPHLKIDHVNIPYSLHKQPEEGTEAEAQERREDIKFMYPDNGRVIVANIYAGNFVNAVRSSSQKHGETTATITGNHAVVSLKCNLKKTLDSRAKKRQIQAT